MNNKSKGRLRLIGIMALAISATALQAQTFRVLHMFSESSWSSGMTNWDGAQPYQTGIILSGNQLYGTTYYGGANGNGAVFSVSTDGSEFAVLYTFSAAPAPDYTNSDGEAPQGGLLLVGDALYGTSLNGGTNSGGYGTLFSVGTDGLDFNLIHSFNSIPDGRNPTGPLVVSGNTLYGTTQDGGATNGNGTIFSINTDGTGYTVLHSLTNQDGSNPYCGLVLSGDTLYGNAEFGGPNGNGSVFSIKTNGDDFTLVHAFTAGTGSYNAYNVDGRFPESPLVISGDTIYGTAVFGGAYGNGTVFSVKTNGADYTVLHTFTPLNSQSDNPDGAYPEGLLLSGGVLYGVTANGGANDNGVVYSLNSDGSNFNVLYTFSDISSLTGWTNFDGAYPEGALVLSGNTLYGTAEQGGTGNGTVFALTITPSITGVNVAGTDLVLNGINGVAGETCTVLTSASLTLPLNQWTPIATNVLAGNVFSITATNAIDRTEGQRYFTLQLQSN